MAAFSFKTPDGASYKFANPPALLAFVTQEINAWAWLYQFQGATATNGIIQSTLTPLNAAQSYLGQQPLSEEVAEMGRVQVQLYLDSLPSLHPKAVLRTAVDKLAQSSPQEAIYMVATIGQQMGKWSPFTDHFGQQSSYVAGVAKGLAYLEGWRSNEKAGAAADTAVEQARIAGEACTEAGNSRDKAQETLNFFQEWEIQHRERLSFLVDTARKDHEQLIEALRSSVGQTSKSLEEDWKRLTATYDSQLALRAPATYWGKKHKRHTNWVLGLALGGFAWLIIGVCVLNVLVVSVFGDAKINTVPTWFQAISFSLGALVFVLVLRSVLRLMMSHVHLSLDAAERQTMIVSYLALVRKGALKEETLEKVLGAIFRPTGDGIVKDEGVPLSVIGEFFRKPG